MHRKGIAKIYSTNFVEGPGHSWNPGLFVDVSWNGRPVGKLLNVTNTQKPLQNFVEGIFDALTCTNFVPALLADHLSTMSGLQSRLARSEVL